MQTSVIFKILTRDFQLFFTQFLLFAGSLKSSIRFILNAWSFICIFAIQGINACIFDSNLYSPLNKVNCEIYNGVVYIFATYSSLISIFHINLTQYIYALVLNRDHIYITLFCIHSYIRKWTEKYHPYLCHIMTIYVYRIL